MVGVFDVDVNQVHVLKYSMFVYHAVLHEGSYSAGDQDIRGRPHHGVVE